MTTKKQVFYIDDFAVNTESDIYDGELMDTKVLINGTYICFISGVYIGDFVNDLRELIKKYKI